MNVPTDRPAETVTQLTARNVQEIARLEAAALKDRTLSDRISDTITEFSGSMTFVWLHLAWIGVWVVWNLEVIPGLNPFDPYPFGLLTMIGSLEAIFISTFVLISQNRARIQAEKRAHLDLQVNLLAEQEMTRLLRMVKLLCDHHRLEIEAREEIDELAQQTDLQHLARELDEKLEAERQE